MTSDMPDLGSDMAARAALKSDPREFLASHGIDMPEQVRIEVHESRPTDLHMVLPRGWTERLNEINDGPLADLLQRAAGDPAFKDRMFDDPVAVARESGLDLPEGSHVHLHEQTPSVHHIVLPPPMENGELSDDDLAMMAGGKNFFSWLEGEFDKAVGNNAAGTAMYDKVLGVTTEKGGDAGAEALASSLEDGA